MNKPGTGNIHYFSSIGISSDPFSTSPDPYYFFPFKTHISCLTYLEIAVRLRRGANVVMGEIGTGKTTICRTFLQRISSAANIETHLMLNPVTSSETDFMKTLASFFRLETSCVSDSQLFNIIKNYLYVNGAEENRTVLLIIDEAQKLTMEALECLRSLLNFETNEYKLLQLILFGQPQLGSKIRSMPNFADRINYKTILYPLTYDECNELILHRLTKAGYSGSIPVFSPGSVQRIYEFSGGYPRKICMIAHRILEQMVMYGKTAADKDFVEAVVAEEVVFN